MIDYRNDEPGWIKTYKKSGKIRIAVPDGHLEPFLRIMFDRIGLKYPTSQSGQIYAETDDYKYEDGTTQKVYISMHRPVSIAEFVRDGHFALGITGKDWCYSAMPIQLNGDTDEYFEKGLAEHGIIRLLDLGYRPTSVVVAVHKDSPVDEMAEFIERYSNGDFLRNAGSELVGLSQNFIDMNKINLQGRLITSYGKSESLLRDGIATAIFEIGETGGSVEINDGKVIYPFIINKTTPQAIARVDALSVPEVERFINNFSGRLGEVKRELENDDDHKESFQDHKLLQKAKRLYSVDV